MNNMLKQILKISLIFICCLVLLSPAKSGYSDSILGTGVNIQSDGKTGHGILKINSKIYQAQNLTIQMGPQIKISGDVYDGIKKSKLVLTGIKVKDTLYEFTGYILGKNGMTNAKLDLYVIGPNPPPPATISKNAPQLDQIKLVVQSFDKVTVGYSYGFSVKTFDKKLNPTGDYDQKNGKISNVDISVAIIDKNNKIVKTMKGKTDSQGYYSDSFSIVNYVPSVTYHVMFNATKSNYLSDSVIKTVFVQPSGTR